MSDSEEEAIRQSFESARLKRARRQGRKRKRSASAYDSDSSTLASHAVAGASQKSAFDGSLSMFSPLSAATHSPPPDSLEPQPLSQSPSKVDIKSQSQSLALPPPPPMLGPTPLPATRAAPFTSPISNSSQTSDRSVLSRLTRLQTSNTTPPISTPPHQSPAVSLLPAASTAVHAAATEAAPAPAMPERAAKRIKTVHSTALSSAATASAVLSALRMRYCTPPLRSLPFHVLASLHTPHWHVQSFAVQVFVRLLPKPICGSKHNFRIFLYSK